MVLISHLSLSFGAPAHKMSKAEKAQPVPDGSSYHFHSSQTRKSLKFCLSKKDSLSWDEAGILVAASQEVLKSWGMSAGACCWLWVGQMCPSSVRAVPPNPSPSGMGCQAKSLVGVVTHSSCHCLLCQGPASSRDRAGELLGTNTASWHSAVHLPELCHDWKGLGTLLLGDKQLLAAQ